MKNKLTTSFNYGASMESFFNSVQRTMIEQPDYKGCGGHGLEKNSHGLHTQRSIGIGNRTVNFRKIQ